MNQSKVILVTGSSSGFGRLTAETLARQGHQVYATLRELTDGTPPSARSYAHWPPRRVYL